jgi:DNA invertase Pin-like site-specific DNA recombinase
MSAAHKPIRAVIYARISEDTAGEARGVARQLDDCRALAAARGWEVAGEFTDNDVSAFTGAKRPGYAALMAAVEAGDVDRIVVYMTSRLWRSRRERAVDLEVLEKHGVPVIPVSGPELDPTTASGRMLIGILGEFDTAESAVKSERVSRAAEQRAAEGRPSGDLGYGWRRVVDSGPDGKPLPARYDLEPAEAAIVREVVERLAAGETLDGLCRDLNARGVPSPGAGHRRRYRSPENPDGTLWVPSGLRKTALRPSNAARRVHRGQVIGAAAWPAIITEAQHHRVVEVLTDPRRRANGGGAVRRHLLSFGIGECGVCGARLRVSPKSRRDKEGKKVTHSLYVCDAPSGCVGRRQEWVDELVEAVVVERLKKPDAADLLAPRPVAGVDPSSVEHLAKLRARLDAAAASYADGKIDGGQMEVISAKLRPQIQEAERAARPVIVTPIPSAATRLAGKRDARAVWDRLDVLTKRAVLEALGITVKIQKTRQGPGFDPDSVTIGWGQST